MDPTQLMNKAIQNAHKGSHHPFAKFENTKAGPWSLASASLAIYQQKSVAAFSRFLNDWGQGLKSLTLPTISSESCPNARVDHECVYACTPSSQGHDCLENGAGIYLDPHQNVASEFPSLHNQHIPGTIDSSVPYIERSVVHIEALSDPSEGALLDDIDDVDVRSISPVAIDNQDSSESEASDPAVEFAIEVPLGGEILENENLEGNKRSANSSLQGVPGVENRVQVKHVSFASEDEVRVIDPAKLSRTHTAKRRRPVSSEPETRDKVANRAVVNTTQPLHRESNTVIHAYGAVDPEDCGVCGQPDNGSVMVCCDKHYQWFHNRCMGLDEAHFIDAWVCPPCRTANLSEPKAPTAEQRRSLPRQRASEPRQFQSPLSKIPPTQKPAKKDKAWEDREKQCVALLMQEILRQQQCHNTEKKWEVISTRLMGKYSIDRSAGSVKNYWNRQGREATGIDERKNKKPDNLVTGVQSPKSRREARKKRKAMENGEEEEDRIDESDADEEIAGQAPRSKKRRKYTNSGFGSTTVGSPFL